MGHMHLLEHVWWTNAPRDGDRLTDGVKKILYK